VAAMRRTGMLPGHVTRPLQTAGRRGIPLGHGSLRSALLPSKNTPPAGLAMLVVESAMRTISLDETSRSQA
jgi:hypothetical protein